MRRAVLRGIGIGGLGALALSAGLFLGGCTFGSDEAQAAEERRIETFVIDPGTFLLRTDDVPGVDVGDERTTYTLTSDGSLTFTPVGGAAQNLGLEAGEVLIERPGIGTLTLVRVAPI